MLRHKIIFLFVYFLMLVLQGSAQDIFDAARKGDVNRMDALMKINPDTLNARNQNGFTPLIIAVYQNQQAFSEALLKHGVNVNVTSPEGPAMLGACYKGNIELVILLLNYKADVNLCNSNGTSGLMYAALSDNVSLAKILLANGAKKNLSEKSGKTALTYAQTLRSTEMILLLSE